MTEDQTRSGSRLATVNGEHLHSGVSARKYVNLDITAPRSRGKQLGSLEFAYRSVPTYLYNEHRGFLAERTSSPLAERLLA